MQVEFKVLLDPLLSCQPRSLWFQARNECCDRGDFIMNVVLPFYFKYLCIHVDCKSRPSQFQPFTMLLLANGLICRNRCLSHWINAYVRQSVLPGNTGQLVRSEHHATLHIRSDGRLLTCTKPACMWWRARCVCTLCSSVPVHVVRHRNMSAKACRATQSHCIARKHFLLSARDTLSLSS